MTPSQSIPISQKSRGFTEEEAELYHHAMIADYKDYVFYSRIVEGIRRKQGSTKDIALRYENQALIDHIVRTRNAHNKRPTLSTSPTSVRNFGDDSSRHTPTGMRRIRSRADLLAHVAGAVQLARDDSEWGEEDNLIFDMDL